MLISGEDKIGHVNLAFDRVIGKDVQYHGDDGFQCGQSRGVTRVKGAGEEGDDLRACFPGCPFHCGHFGPGESAASLPASIFFEEAEPFFDNVLKDFIGNVPRQSKSRGRGNQRNWE